MASAEQIVRDLLEKIAKEQNFVNYILKVDPIDTKGANYSTTLFNIILIESDGTVLHMFAKVAAHGEALRNQAPKIYATEISAYLNLASTYQRLQNEHKVPRDCRLTFAKMYGFNPKLYEETIVLENLAKEGYQNFNRFEIVSWNYSVAAITELARLHALSYAYAEYYPEDFKKTLSERKNPWSSGEMMANYYKEMITKCIDITMIEHRSKMEKYFENFSAEEYSDFCQRCRKPVLVHGDFRTSNLMHKIKEDGTVDIKIVDLQTLQGASPVVDLLYFIFTGSDEQFRAQYYDKLVDHYYSELEAAMKRLHLEPQKVYSRADFEFELEEKLPFGLTIAVFALPVVTVDVEYAPKVDEDMDMSAFSVEKTSDLFTERLNGVVNDYVKWGILK